MRAFTSRGLVDIGMPCEYIRGDVPHASHPFSDPASQPPAEALVGARRARGARRALRRVVSPKAAFATRASPASASRSSRSRARTTGARPSTSSRRSRFIRTASCSASSLIVGWFFTLGLATRDGLPNETMANCYVITAIAALVGSRILYILTNSEPVRHDRGLLRAPARRARRVRRIHRRLPRELAVSLAPEHPAAPVGGRRGAEPRVGSAHHAHRLLPLRLRLRNAPLGRPRQAGCRSSAPSRTCPTARSATTTKAPRSSAASPSRTT